MSRGRHTTLIVHGTLALLWAASVAGCAIPVPSRPVLARGRGPCAADGCPMPATCPLVYNRTEWHPLCMAECPEPPAVISAPHDTGPFIPEAVPETAPEEPDRPKEPAEGKPKEPAEAKKGPEETSLVQPPGVLEGMSPLESPETFEEIPPLQGPPLAAPGGPSASTRSATPSPTAPAGVPDKKTDSAPPATPTAPRGSSGKAPPPSDAAGSPGSRPASEVVGEGAALLPERIGPLRKLIVPGLPPEAATARLQPAPRGEVEPASWDPAG